MKVEVTRRGGIAGIALRGAADTADLPVSQQAAAEAALDVLPFGAPSETNPYPDSFQFEIAVLDGTTHSSAVVDESALADALQPLVQAAMAKGEPG